MAIILQYRRPDEPAPRPAEAEDRVLGQIIIFPGVRIDRYAEAAPKGKVSPARKGAQRSRKKQRR
jgi:hypothetical protein